MQFRGRFLYFIDLNFEIRMVESMSDLSNTQFFKVQKDIPVGVTEVLKQVYDALVEKVAASTDPSEAIAYVAEADDIAGNEYVFLNLYYKNGTSLMHPYVQGFYINASGMMYLKTASVSK